MTLSGKEKSDLRATGQELKPQIWVGKEGITEGVIQNLQNVFNTRELVKIRILENCPTNKKQTAENLSGKTGSDIVQIVGNIILLYRPLPEDSP